MYVKRSLLMRLNDVVEIIKSRTGLQNCDNAEDSIFTGTERKYCAKRLRCLGARFIIKKCVLDYLSVENGCDVSHYGEVEVVNNELGQPMLRTRNEVRACIDYLKINDILISISHSRNWVTGMVLFCY